MILFARDVLKEQPGATIVGEVKCSQTLYDDIAKPRAASRIMWKAGHSLIKAKMKETDALLAGEMSGHIFFGTATSASTTRSTPSARLLEILAHEPKPLAELLADVPETFATPELRVDSADEMKFERREARHRARSQAEGHRRHRRRRRARHLPRRLGPGARLEHPAGPGAALRGDDAGAAGGDPAAHRGHHRPGSKPRSVLEAVAPSALGGRSVDWPAPRAFLLSNAQVAVDGQRPAESAAQKRAGENPARLPGRLTPKRGWPRCPSSRVEEQKCSSPAARIPSCRARCGSWRSPWSPWRSATWSRSTCCSTAGCSAIISSTPDDLKVTWSSAWSPWPGRAYVRGFYLRIQQKDAQVELTIDHTGAYLVVLAALLERRFQTRWVQANGVELRLRPRLIEREDAAERAAPYPPIAGFATPPLFDFNVPEPPASRRWAVRLEGVEVTELRQASIAAYRGVLDAHVRGRMWLTREGSLQVGPARLLGQGRPHLQGTLPVATDLAGELACTIGLEDVHGGSKELLRALSGTLDVEGTLVSVALLNYHLLDQAHPDFEGGKAHFQLGLGLDRGLLRAGSLLALRRERAHGERNRLPASGQLERARLGGRAGGDAAFLAGAERDAAGWRRPGGDCSRAPS